MRCNQHAKKSWVPSSLDPGVFLDYIGRVDSAEQFELVRLVNGTTSIRSLRVGETFHPVIGPVNEARALYVDQLNLLERMESSEGEFVIWDVGLGAGANALTVLRETRSSKRMLKLISFDRSLEPLQFAVRHAVPLGYFDSYTEQVHEILRHANCSFVDGKRNVRWTFQLGDFPEFLRTASFGQLPAPHVVLFDAYSPLRNPEMWTLEVFSRLFKLLDRDRPCLLPTYSRSTLLRVTLLLAGFSVGVGHATGEKNETTIASNSQHLLAEPLGKAWLERAKRSSSAEPLHEPSYRQAPLSLDSLRRLRFHPQFNLPMGDQ
jgi:tRNA U34 5-methylaminomethyl-2-thiouridine-forming methyltransferase MnmC